MTSMRTMRRMIVIVGQCDFAKLQMDEACAVFCVAGCAAGVLACGVGVWVWVGAAEGAFEVEPGFDCATAGVFGAGLFTATGAGVGVVATAPVP